MKFLIQFWLGRAVCGGLYVKTGGVWHQCFTLLHSHDGTRYLSYEDPTSKSNTSFHETHVLVERIQEFP